MGLAATAFLTAVIVVLTLIAHQAKRSRRAEVSLLSILFFLSVLVTLVGVLLFAALGLGEMGGLSGASLATMGGVLALSGLAGMVLCAWPFLRILGRTVKPAVLGEPTVFLGLWLFIVVLANNIVGFIAFSGLDDVGSLVPGGGEQLLSPVEILGTAVPLVIIAFFGVGFLVRRSPRETLRRLGFGGISLPQLGVIGLFVVGSLALAFAADAAFAALQPDLYEQVGDLSEGLFNPAGYTLGGALLFALMVGLAAGIGEETLLRGAVQPVFGIFATSLLFASLHIQYGPSIILAQIFIWSLAVGVLRNRINTTACIIAHAAYNFCVVMLSFSGLGV